jgi:glycosyltransferase involved in cell wall biosynthesis
MNLSKEPFFHILGYDTEHTGYGIHTKEFINTLRKHKKNFLFTDITQIKTYADREKIKNFLSQKQNVYNISINYGSDCYNVVKYYEGLKIGWTVWESSIIPDNWKDELNKLDQVWIPSKWGKNILIMNGVDKYKIKVVPEGVNTEVFKLIENLPENNITRLKGFKFLNIGKYEGRKNTDLLIRAFDEEFNKEEEVFLFLQSYNAFIPNFNMNQILDSMNLRNREKIYVISPLKKHNDLSVIYNSCDCFVYPTRAEGWGLPLIEALSCGMNAIACNNGGQSEYLYNPKQEIYIDLKYSMIDITRKDFGNFMFHTNNANNNMGQWAEIDINELKTKIRYVFENNINNNKNIVGMQHIHQYWSWDKLLENENLR